MNSKTRSYVRRMTPNSKTFTPVSKKLTETIIDTRNEPLNVKWYGLQLKNHIGLINLVVSINLVHNSLIQTFFCGQIQFFFQ